MTVMILVLRRNRLELVIKTAVKPRGPGLPSRRPFGSVYQAGKAGLQLSGYYDKYQLWRYDPDYLYQKHVRKYTYKPRKRVAGYLGQAFHAKKRIQTRYQVYKKFSNCGSKYWNNNCTNTNM